MTLHGKVDNPWEHAALSTFTRQKADLDHVALDDARALDDPVMVGVHPFGQIVVGDDFRRHMAPQCADLRPAL